MTEPLTVEQVRAAIAFGIGTGKAELIAEDWLRLHAELEAKDAEIEQLEDKLSAMDALAAEQQAENERLREQLGMTLASREKWRTKALREIYK